MQKIKCFFGLHDRKVAINVTNYYDVSWGDRQASTGVTWQYPCCKKTWNQSLYGAGFLQMKDLNQ